MQLCKCGCGELTKSRSTEYRPGHHKRIKNRELRPKTEFCLCGCGGKPGRYSKYLPGHWAKAHPECAPKVVRKDRGPLPVCKCGCGKAVNNHRASFLPGHASRSDRKCSCGCGEWPPAHRKYVVGHHKRPELFPFNSVSEAELSWVAGFIDGEGCFSAGIRKNTYHIGYRIMVGQVCKDPLVFLKDKFGGSVVLNRAATARTSACWTWSVSGRNASRLAKQLVPYLKIKKEQALLFVLIHETLRTKGLKGPIPLSQEEVTKRHSLVAQIQGLNGRYCKRAANRKNPSPAA